MVERNEDEFVSFEKALRDLKLQSEELKRMVSEGEIRAFRDGPSMKFKREDVEVLRGRQGQPDFADALEDDTGMVTEELTEEETLLADEDLLEEEPEPTTVRRRSTPAAATTTRRTRVEVGTDEPKEPGWVTAVAVLTALVCIYGFMIVFSIAAEQPPSGLTSIFGK